MSIRKINQLTFGFNVAFKQISPSTVKNNRNFNGKRLQCKTVNWLTESFHTIRYITCDRSHGTVRLE